MFSLNHKLQKVIRTSNTIPVRLAPVYCCALRLAAQRLACLTKIVWSKISETNQTDSSSIPCDPVPAVSPGAALSLILVHRGGRYTINQYGIELELRKVRNSSEEHVQRKPAQ